MHAVQLHESDNQSVAVLSMDSTISNWSTTAWATPPVMRC